MADPMMIDSPSAARTQKREYRYEGSNIAYIDVERDIGPTDLREEALALLASGDIRDNVSQIAYIVVSRPGGFGHGTEPEIATALYVPHAGRLGIAWGADATWSDVLNLDDGIDCWLNDPDEWDGGN